MVIGEAAVPETVGLIDSAYVPLPMFRVKPAASFETPLVMVQNGASAVPMPVSLQIGLVLST